MNTQPIDAFVEAGMGRYSEAVETVRAFEEEVKSRLVAILNARTNDARWKSFRHSGVPKAGASHSAVEVYASVEGRFGKKKCRLVVGLSWDPDNLGDQKKPLWYAGFSGNSEYKVTPKMPKEASPAMLVPGSSWDDRCFALHPQGQKDLSTDLNAMLDEIELQVAQAM